jgi:hypothetical protein
LEAGAYLMSSTIPVLEQALVYSADNKRLKAKVNRQVRHVHAHHLELESIKRFGGGVSPPSRLASGARGWDRRGKVVARNRVAARPPGSPTEDLGLLCIILLTVEP